MRTVIAQYRAGHALPQAFAVSEAIHEHGMDTISRSSWLFAGPSVQARRRGDFFRLDLAAGDSVIIVRAEDGELHALHNTCRHRRMRVCPEPSGRARRWVCPYHQWSYALDGRLLGCGGEQASISTPTDCATRRRPRSRDWCSSGWVPAPHQSMSAREISLPHSPRRARPGAGCSCHRVRSAGQLEAGVGAQRECWHCHAGHPEYVRASFDASPDTEHHRRRAASARHSMPWRSPTSMAVARHDGPGLYRFPAAGRWWSANRTPLSEGFVTESLDGRPVTPLMGDE